MTMSERDRKEGLFTVTRRQFLKAAGGGLIVLFSWGSLPAQEQRPRSAAALTDDFNALLSIQADGKVKLFTGKIEMGQGIVTSLAQMLAEELDVDVDSVDMVMGDTDLCPFDNGTFGSLSTRFYGNPMRHAAAEARGVLLEMASRELKVPASQLTVRNGTVLDSKNIGARITYAELVKGKRIEKRLVPQPPVKTPKAYTVMGKSPVRKDGIEKITGKALYAGDIRLPGMLFGKVLRPPAHGAKLRDVDVSAAETFPDVRIVRDGDFIGILHPQPDLAEKALSLVKARWDIRADSRNPSTIHDHLMKVAPVATIIDEGGNVETARIAAAATHKATYYDHYMAHAPIETHTATVKIDGGRVTVWPSSQRPFAAKDEVARALSIPAEKVRVIMPFVGGGFGGKSANRQAVEAARLASLSGRPVQVHWSRADEFFYDTFRPAAIVTIDSGTDQSGKISFWNYDAYYCGPRGAEQFYAIAHHREAAHGGYTTTGAHPFATGPWRAPGANINCFARECHIDTLASLASADPVAYRLSHLNDDRIRRVLSTAVDKFAWKNGKAPSGRGQGVACGVDAGATVATMAEVEVDKKTGKVRVTRMVHAQDMGVVVNPEGARAQIEGGLSMGLGYSLAEEIHFEGGRIIENNFDTYEIPRFSWLPSIETVLINNPGLEPQGGGEPPIICVGAAIGNAIFDATGARLFDLPMTPERVRKALEKVTG
jgi:nicotinate dehydrogenase subunit B